MAPINQLGVCIALDILGAITYLLPGLGELGDIAYAPVQGYFAWMMFGGEKWGVVWTGVAFTEELLPFFDFFPSMTVGWFWKFMM
jgi:hypothetical protein